jgi:hypothetical protein
VNCLKLQVNCSKKDMEKMELKTKFQVNINYYLIIPKVFHNDYFLNSNILKNFMDQIRINYKNIKRNPQNKTKT